MSDEKSRDDGLLPEQTTKVIRNDPLCKIELRYVVVNKTNNGSIKSIPSYNRRNYDIEWSGDMQEI